MGEALAVAGPVLVSLGVIESGGGYSAVEVAAAEHRLGRPLPGEVREFYRAVRPSKWAGQADRKAFGFYPLDSVAIGWIWSESAEPPAEWARASALALGQTRSGHAFWHVEGHGTLPDGGIVLVDQQPAAGGSVTFTCFARSFREFIGKVAYFRGLVSTEQDPLFREEYRELNRAAA
jgi:hypothetical protein